MVKKDILVQLTKAVEEVVNAVKEKLKGAE